MAKNPTNDELAERLGLSGWRWGGHEARGGRPAVEISYLWQVRAAPAFDHGWVLAGACGGDAGRIPAPPGRLRVVLAREAEAVTAEVAGDAVAEAIRRVCLLPPPPAMVYADGISYGVEVDTYRVSGQVHFSNPVDPSLVALERAALALAASWPQVASGRSSAARGQKTPQVRPA